MSLIPEDNVDEKTTCSIK